MFRINRLAFALGVNAAKTVAKGDAAVIVREHDGLRLTVEKRHGKQDNCGLAVSTPISQGAALSDVPPGTPTRWQVDLAVCKRIVEALAGVPGDLVVDNMNNAGRLTLKCGGVSFSVGIVCSGDKLPDIERTDIDHGSMATMGRDALATTYRVVGASAQVGCDRQRMIGVAVDRVRDTLIAFATEGASAAIERMPDAAQDMPATWLHRSVVKYLAKTYPAGADVQVSGQDAMRTRLDCSPTTWSWDTQSPVDIAAVFPADKPTVTLDVTDAMANAIALAAASTTANWMHVEMKPEDARAGVAVIRSVPGAPPFFADFPSEHAPIRIGFCAIRMHRILGDGHGLTMELREPLRPIIIRRRGFLAGIVGPVRL